MADAVNKKIAVIRSTYSPFGGAETLTLDLIHAILKTSCHVHLLTARGQKWPLEDKLLTTVFLPVTSKQRLLEAWSFEKAVGQYLRSNQFDIVFSIDRVTSYTHLHAGGGTHKAFLATKDRVSSLPERIFRKTSLFHRYVLQLERKGFQNPILRKIHCCSQMVANDIRKDYNMPVGKLQVIYNGIRWEDIGEIYNRRRENADRIGREENLDPHPRWLLFLGSGYRRKGLDIAIQGLSALPESYRLLIVGSGKEAPVRRQADRLGLGDRIRILGPRPDGWRYAALCCAMVLPSRYEPFGLAAAEAQGMGLPVLVSDRTGYGELIEDGVTGIRLPSVSDVNRVHEAFRNLARLVENPAVSSGEIRHRIRHLDNRIIQDRMIHEFLEL